MIEWVVIGVAAAAATGVAARWFGKRKTHVDWSSRLEEVATKVGGRASTANQGDDPELRAEIDGLTVTLRLVDMHAGARGRVEAQSSLPDPDNTARLYLGWDAAEIPVAVQHMPEVAADGPSRLDGHVVLRADDATLAHRALAAARLELVDVRREAQARAVEMTARGGYLTLVVHGLEPTASLLERALRVTAKLAQLVDDASRGTALPAVAASEDRPGEAPAPQTVEPVPADARCELCDLPAREGVRWFRCARCQAPYHEDCWTQATSCLVVDCTSTRANPVQS